LNLNDNQELRSGLYDELLDNVDKALDTASKKYQTYQKDPIGFGEKELGDHYTEDVKKLLESVRDNEITIAVSATGVGKTHAAARVATWFYKCFPNSKTFLGAAPPIDNLENLLWGEISSVVRKNKKMFATDYITYLSISSKPPLTSKTIEIEEDEDPNISFIKGVTIPSSGTAEEREAKFSGKHAPNLLFGFDEGDAVPDEPYKGAEGCMSGGFVRMLIMFNPKQKLGAAYRMIRDNRANVVYLSAFNHPNVITGEDIIPGAVTREATVRRINQWTRPLAEGENIDSECYKLPDFLVGAVAKSQSGVGFPPLKAGYYKIMEPAFSYMVLGRYPAKGSNQLISEEWVSKARARWDAYVSENGERPPQGSMAVMGLDVAEFGADLNSACFRYGGWVERFLIWGGVDTIVTGDRAVNEYKKRNVIRANIDATGVGTGVAPYMRREDCFADSIKVASSPTEVLTELGEFKILRDQLWWACREWLRTDPGAMLPPDEELIEELCTPTYDEYNGKIRVMDKETMRELLKRSPNKADSLCLTFAPSGFFFD